MEGIAKVSKDNLLMQINNLQRTISDEQFAGVSFEATDNERALDITKIAP